MELRIENDKVTDRLRDALEAPPARGCAVEALAPCPSDAARVLHQLGLCSSITVGILHYRPKGNYDTLIISSNNPIINRYFITD
jgi:hypothetical protein